MAVENEAAIVPAGNLTAEMQRKAGVYALGAQTEAEFTETTETLTRGLERLDRIIASVLKPGVDYDEPAYAGTYKGPDGKEHRKKNLLLPGAEKLCFVARLVPTYLVTRTVGATPAEPPVHYLVTCQLHMGSADGPVVGEGVGSCNAFEVKYRYRIAERRCPKCGMSGSVRRSRFPWKGTDEKAWWCNPKLGGCDSSYAPNEPDIVDQKGGRVDNPDPMDLDNTLLKMAKTRAMRDGVKSVTGGSARLTQDLEDYTPPEALDRGEAEVVEADATERTLAGGDSAKDASGGERYMVVNRLLSAASKKGLSLAELLEDIGKRRANGKPPFSIRDVRDDELDTMLKELES